MDIIENCLGAVKSDAKKCIDGKPLMWRTSFGMKNSLHRKGTPGREIWSSSFSKSGSVSLFTVAGIFAGILLIIGIAVKIKKTLNKSRCQ